ALDKSQIFQSKTALNIPRPTTTQSVLNIWQNRRKKKYHSSFPYSERRHLKMNIDNESLLDNPPMNSFYSDEILAKVFKKEILRPAESQLMRERNGKLLR
ncbi:17602_t:CDS:2, partial [Entrophospora sp. SA101]